MKRRVKTLANALVGDLVRRPSISEALMRATYYPRFAQWKHDNDCREVGSEPSEGRSDYFSTVLNSESLAGPIDFLEFGVCQGESIRWWAEQNLSPASRFVGFDSFEGLPETVSKHWHKGRFSTGGDVPEIADDRVTFVPGWFKDSLPEFFRTYSRRNRLIVHLDADIYSSTLCALVYLVPFLHPGDVLMFDEFADSIHEFRAFSDVASAIDLQFSVIAQEQNFMKVALRVTAGVGHS